VTSATGNRVVQRQTKTIKKVRLLPGDNKIVAVESEIVMSEICKRFKL